MSWWNPFTAIKGVINMVSGFNELGKQKDEINRQQSQLEQQRGVIDERLAEQQASIRRQKEINLSSASFALVNQAKQGLEKSSRLGAIMAERGIDDSHLRNIINVETGGNVSRIKESLSNRQEEIDRQLQGMKKKATSEKQIIDTNLQTLQDNKPDTLDYLITGVKAWAWD